MDVVTWTWSHGRTAWFFSFFLNGTCVEFTNEQRHFKFPTKKISDGIFKDVLWKICKKKPVNSPITRSICDYSKNSLFNTLHFVPTNVFWLIVFDLSEEWYMVSLNQSFKCLPEGHYINESSLRDELPHDFPKSHLCSTVAYIKV